jgi:hypothetical protein
MAGSRSGADTEDSEYDFYDTDDSEYSDLPDLVESDDDYDNDADYATVPDNLAPAMRGTQMFSVEASARGALHLNVLFVYNQFRRSTRRAAPRSAAGPFQTHRTP